MDSSCGSEGWNAARFTGGVMEVVQSRILSLKFFFLPLTTVTCFSLRGNTAVFFESRIDKKVGWS